MAIAASTCEIRTTGSTTNGGGFVTGATGVDYSQQDAAQWALTTATSSGAGNTILDASAHDDMVGNWACAVSGTNLNQGFYAVDSVVAGVSITFSTRKDGTSIAAGAVANGVINIGGAFKLGATSTNRTDDDFFESAPNTGGSTYWIKSGTYAPGGTISISATGTIGNRNYIRGYNITRDDNPINTDRPILIFGTAALSFGAFWSVYNLSITGASTSLITISHHGYLENCKIVNTSITANRNAILNNGINGQVVKCELISYRGIAFNASNTTIIQNCVIRSSNIGLQVGTVSAYVIRCVFMDNITTAINSNGASGLRIFILNCTLYGAENKLGIGVTCIAGSSFVSVNNSILYGFTTALNHNDTINHSEENFNTISNCTTARTNWPTGSGSITLAPNFTSMLQRTGTTATTSGNTITQSGATFQTWGITAGRDYIYLVSGTGITTGVYGITSVDSETQLTLDIAPGTNATTDKVWQITHGYDISTGTNMQRVANNSFSTPIVSNSYLDIGAIQSNQNGWFTDVGAINVLTTVGDYQYNSLSNNRTPTAVSSPPVVKKMSNSTSRHVRKTSSIA